jgi:hypothetical protein
MSDHPFQAGGSGIHIPNTLKESAGADYSRVGNVEKEGTNIEESRRRVGLFFALCSSEDRCASAIIARGSVPVCKVGRYDSGTQSHAEMRNEGKVFVSGLEADEEDHSTVAHIEGPLVECLLTRFREVARMSAGFGGGAKGREDEGDENEQRIPVHGNHCM